MFTSAHGTQLHPDFNDAFSLIATRASRFCMAALPWNHSINRVTFNKSADFRGHSAGNNATSVPVLGLAVLSINSMVKAAEVHAGAHAGSTIRLKIVGSASIRLIGE